jgi:hypothetical protein
MARSSHTTGAALVLERSTNSCRSWASGYGRDKTRGRLSEDLGGQLAVPEHHPGDRTQSRLFWQHGPSPPALFSPGYNPLSERERGS